MFFFLSFLSILVKTCCNKIIHRAMPKNNRATSVVLLQSLVCYLLPGRKGGGEVGWLVALLYRHKHRIFRVPRSRKLSPHMYFTTKCIIQWIFQKGYRGKPRYNSAVFFVHLFLSCALYRMTGKVPTLVSLVVRAMGQEDVSKLLWNILILKGAKDGSRILLYML